MLRLIAVIFNFSPITIAFVAVFTVLVTVFFRRKDKGLPPGPTGLPYLGYWLFFNNKTAYLQLQELGKKYGDVFCFRALGHIIVNLGSVRALKEYQVLKSDCFATRPTSFVLMDHIFGGGIVSLNGEKWKITRRFFLQAFKECGMTSSEAYHECLSATFEDLVACQGNPVDMTNIMLDRCSKTMRDTLFGHEGVTNEEIRDMCEAYGKILETLSSVKLFMFGGVAKKIIFPLFGGYRESKIHRQKMLDVLYKNIARHESRYDENNIRDLIDMYIKERRTRLQKGDPAAKYFTNEVLACTLLQAVGDGILSVAAYVNIFLQGLVKYPEEQEKVHEEIIDVIGPDRQPTMDDKNKLPYTNAYMYEIIRKTDFTPMLPSVECTTETTIRGHRIPKGAVTLANYWAANHDPETYDDPDTFNPSRFLTTINKPRAELPVLFGVGKRACIGEIFTTTQAFLFLTSIAQKFRLSKPSDPADTDSVSLTPGHTYLIAHPRKEE